MPLRFLAESGSSQLGDWNSWQVPTNSPLAADHLMRQRGWSLGLELRRRTSPPYFWRPRTMSASPTVQDSGPRW